MERPAGHDGFGIADGASRKETKSAEQRRCLGHATTIVEEQVCCASGLMACARVACIHRVWGSRHRRRCCKCGANGGDAARAGAAARATIAGCRVPPQRKCSAAPTSDASLFVKRRMQRGHDILVCPPYFYQKTSAACFYALHACIVEANNAQQCPVT